MDARPPRRALAWGVLVVLLAATVIAAALFDRRGWPALLGDEATYLMAAESLAWDFDLTYTRADYDRFVDHWQRPPDGLILQRGDDGLAYGKPFLYPLWIAPFVRLAPTRGAAVANALLLALAGLVAARSLGRRLGETTAAWWMVAFLYASVAFASVFWAHPDLFLMALTALALALAFGGERPAGEPQEIYAGPETEPRRRLLWRWLAVGVLLGLVAAARPVYAPLLVAVAAALPRGNRRDGSAALAAGALAALALSAAVSFSAAGSWTPYGGERQGFYGYTGFPEVDGSWRSGAADAGSWLAPAALSKVPEADFTAWNLLYFAVGRHVGVLPYYLPLLLGFVAFERRRGRAWLLAAALLSTAALFYLRPFNFYGGGGAIANRYFLPLYPVFWFLAARAVRARWALVVALAAAPFLWPSWTAPLAFPLAEQGGFRYVSTAARRWLPYETTQRQLKPAGRDDLEHNGLWIKILRPGLRPAADGTLRLAAGATAELLVGSPRRLDTLRLEARQPAPVRLIVAGAEVERTVIAPDGGTVFDLRLGSPRARHSMWWQWDEVWLYQLRIDPPTPAAGGAGALTFRLEPRP